MIIINIWGYISLTALLLVGVLELMLRRDGFKLKTGLGGYSLICIIPILHLYFALNTVAIISDLLIDDKQDRIQLLKEVPEFAVRL